MEVHPTKNVSIGIDPYPFQTAEATRARTLALSDRCSPKDGVCFQTGRSEGISQGFKMFKHL
jgi:hypothetical protein